MTQQQRREYLITYLLNENENTAQYFELVKDENGEYLIPEDEETQKNLLRALMNVREPDLISSDFLQIQDEYLQERNKERGFTDIEDLTPVNSESLYLWKGDITTLKVDAIVNAANSALLGCFAPLHSCIDNCIHTFAGIQLRLECNEIMQKQQHAEGTGLCKITKAYNLPCKYVLHTVGPIISSFVSPQQKILLANCYKNCLETAAQNNCHSVAFCCISTGVFHFPPQMAAEIAVKTVREWLSKNQDKSVKRVVFNVFSDKDLNIYENILK